MDPTSFDRTRLTRALELARELHKRRPWRALDGPQMMAYTSQADIIGYGGAAGGGKTDLVAGCAVTQHKRCLVIRREKAQTEGVVQRLGEIVGSTTGYNSQHSRWHVPVGTCPLIEFGGLDNPGDERRWQGRPHDLKAFDEVTEMREEQVRFIMGWTRSNDPSVRAQVIMTFNPPTTTEGRWVIEFFAPWLRKGHPNPAMPGELRWFTTVAGRDREVPDGRPFILVDDVPCYEFEPLAHPVEDVITPKSRTFIPARLTDNPYYMRTGYMATLQALPATLRAQMLYGDFEAGMSDDAWQVIPTAWVEEAMARWRERRPKGEQMSLGVDVARGGKDNTTICARYKTEEGALWFDKLRVYPGTETPDGPRVAGLVVAERRDDSPIHIDVIGVGASPYDTLNSMGLPVYGVNVSEKALGTDKSGRLRFMNQRSELWWRMREMLDPANDTGAMLPPDKDLATELCTPKWKLSGTVIKVSSRDEIYAEIGRSVDRASALMLATMDTPKLARLTGRADVDAVRSYDPYASIRS